ncbi:methyltransferase [Devosia nitrariae]|uniref:Methyltransferase n=1 Tax=Devosia nitrariae TaxID=2071872 RepID=A0ABQ5VZ53_9HYPH|nr:methyltransferase [Devosia nitrariae]GLQ52841.1 methyltransferase [Devosia nitrariae]
MIKAFHSSGDMVADRRADYARRLAEAGDFSSAAELIEQALELVPVWTAGWDFLGLYCEKAGDIAGAISAWRHLEALDDAGIFGAQLKLAAHGAASAGDSTAVGYVEALFDQYAPRFERALVQSLGYRVPERLDGFIGEVMAEKSIAAFAEAIDLGCGTGLMGERLRSKVSFLEGVDLSAAMIAETGRKGIYDRLAKAELVRFLNDYGTGVDLITAADVFIYCGVLPPVLAAAARVMRPGALLAFSLEAHDGPEPQFLRPSLRYAHAPEPTRQAIADAGLDILRFERAALRQDRGAPIEGLLIVAQKPPAAPVVLDLAGETVIADMEPEAIN